jgi:hypothetical protein
MIWNGMEWNETNKERRGEKEKKKMALWYAQPFAMGWTI